MYDRKEDLSQMYALELKDMRGWCEEMLDLANIPEGPFRKAYITELFAGDSDSPYKLWRYIQDTCEPETESEEDDKDTSLKVDSAPAGEASPTTNMPDKVKIIQSVLTTLYRNDMVWLQEEMFGKILQARKDLETLLGMIKRRRTTALVTASARAILRTGITVLPAADIPVTLATNPRRAGSMTTRQKSGSALIVSKSVGVKSI